MNRVNNQTVAEQLVLSTSNQEPAVFPSPTLPGPDGGGGAGGGYGGGGGGSGAGGGGAVRTAQPPPQQDKAPPQPSLIHHPASHMMNYHSGRPAGQGPPGAGAALPPYLHTTYIRPQPRQLSTPRPATLIPYFDSNSLCPFYSSALPIPMIYQGGGSGAAERAPPPPGPYSWAANPAAQPQVTLIGGPQPPAPQPNPQQQPQPQPSPFTQGQYPTYLSTRVHQSYTPGGGGSGSGGGPGVQQPPPTTVLVDQRQMQPPGAQQVAAKLKTTRKNRIPIIDPDTGMEINLEEGAAAGAGGASGGSGLHLHQDHTGGGGHPHSQLQHATTNQVSSSGNAAHIAADFAKQVALAAMNETSRVPREVEEPQVNGPGSVGAGAGGASLVGPASVEEPAPPPVTTSLHSKRPPVPTPVVSAQAEGTTYDIQTIRFISGGRFLSSCYSLSANRNNSRVEIGSGESSPARSKVSPVQTSSSGSVPLPVHHQQSNAPLMMHPAVQPTVQQHQPLPQHVTVQQHATVQHHVSLQQHQPIPTQVHAIQQQHSPVQQHAQIPQHVPVAQHSQVAQHTQAHQSHVQVQQHTAVHQPVQQHIPLQPANMQHHPSVSPVQPSSEHHAQPPQTQVQAQPITQSQIKPLIEQPKQQRRPREDKKPSAKPPLQVAEEKEEGARSRTSSGARQQTPVPQEEELVTAVATPALPTRTAVAQAAAPEKLASHSPVDKPQHQVSRPQPQPVVEKQTREKPAEKAVEKPQPVESVEKVEEAVKGEVEKEKSGAKTEKKSSPAPVAQVAPTKKTTFAEGLSLTYMKVSAKAAAQQAAAATAQSQAAQQAESTDSTDTSHSQGKSMSKAKQKGKNKQREMNQKGVEKEGTDMDAFLDSSRPPPPDNNNRLSNDLNKTNNISTTNNQDNRNPDRPNDRPYDNALSNSKNLADSKTDSTEKSPAQSHADATNNNINNIIAQKMDDGEEDSGDDDIVATKNQENSLKNSLEDGSLSDDSSQVISSSQPSLKYQYKDDQWSPVNPQGKKVYDRDFLMKLREDPQSSKKPDITTDLEIFVKEGAAGAIGGGGATGSMRRNPAHGSYSSFSSSSASMRNNSNIMPYPDLFRTSLSQRMPTKRNSQGAGGNRGPGGGQRSLKQMHSWNLRDEVKLNLSENAWKPSKLNRTQEQKSKDDREKEELYKKVRGILNKLTPQKFDTLVLQFQNLPICNLERLQGTIKLVFEKAVDEPAFSVSYANLCKVLAKLQVFEGAQTAQNQDPTAQAKVQPVLFRKLLITRCQQEFETNKKLELDFEKKQQDINETPDLEKRKELQLLFNEEERKIRMKSVGLVTFIGELFKLKMLTANIMHNCIKQLLGKIDEESLECLCKLLTTIGKEFEEQITHIKSGQGGLPEFDDYFIQMTKLSRKHEGSKVSSRVRFMLQDVIELRQNHWVPRRDENKPKTMAQIQAEVERESEKAAILASQPLRQSQNMNQDRGNRRNNPRGMQNDDGWTSVTSSKYARNTSFVPEVAKIQGLRTTANMELDRGARGETVLGPATGYTKWGVGAGSSTRSQSSTSSFSDGNSFSALLDSERKLAHTGSRFSALKMTDSKEADKKEALLSTAAFMQQSRDRDNSRDTSRGRGGSPSPSLSGPMRKPMSLEQPSRPSDMQRRVQNESGRGGSTESSRESTPSLMSNLVDKSRLEAPPPPPPIDEDKLKKSATIIIEEYINNVNIQESVECFKEQFVDASSIFVSTCLNYIVEQMKRDKRQKTSQLLGGLIKHQQFPPSVLVSELQVFFEMIYDLTVDIPHIWQYLGEVFGDIMCIGNVDFGHVKEASQPIPESSCDVNRMEATLREVFKLLLLEKGPVAVKKLWDLSHVQIKDFISDEAAANKFLADYAFLEGKDVVASDSNMSFAMVEEKLLGFLNANGNFDEICGWLTSNVGTRTADPWFIRHLTEAVIKSSVITSTVDGVKSYKFDKSIFNRNLKFIKRYVDNNEQLELWCLYSVQYCVVQSLVSPSGMLVEIFRELYEGNVISPEGFQLWKQDESQCQGWQKEGRGVAVVQSNAFFQALEQINNDDPEDEPS